MLERQATSGLTLEDAQEAGYETPPDDTLECTSQVEKHEQSDDDDEFDEDDEEHHRAVLDGENHYDTRDEAHNGDEKETQGNQMHQLPTDENQDTSYKQGSISGAAEEELLIMFQKKTSVLQAENRRLKAKLSKSKTQNETLTQKHNSVHESLKVMEDRLTQQIEITTALRGELDDIRRNQDKVEKSDVKDILARVRVAGSGYTLLLEASGKTVWHSDQQIVKIQTQLYSEWKKVQQVVYENVHPEREQLQQELSDMQEQHQIRLKKLNEVVEKQNEKFKQNEEELRKAEETFTQGSNAQHHLMANRSEYFTVLNQLTSELSSAVQFIIDEHESYEGAITTIGQSQQFFDQLKPPQDDPISGEIGAMVYNLFHHTFVKLLRINQKNKNVVDTLNTQIEQLTEDQHE